MPPVRILLAEDDAPLAGFLHQGLTAAQYLVDVAADGEQARALVGSDDYQLAILDVNLPRLSGWEILKHARAVKPALPVMFLSGRAEIRDRVQGLDLGADDYLTKPFSFSELNARVRALLRRGTRPAHNVLRVADLELDRVAHCVKRADKRIELTRKEYALLEYLALNARRRLTRAMIIEHVWDLSFAADTKIIDVYVNYLRGKVDEGFEPKLIHTIRGIGYQFG